MPETAIVVKSSSRSEAHLTLQASAALRFEDAGRAVGERDDVRFVCAGFGIRFDLDHGERLKFSFFFCAQPQSFCFAFCFHFTTSKGLSTPIFRAYCSTLTRSSTI